MTIDNNCLKWLIPAIKCNVKCNSNGGKYFKTVKNWLKLFENIQKQFQLIKNSENIMLIFSLNFLI